MTFDGLGSPSYGELVDGWPVYSPGFGWNRRLGLRYLRRRDFELPALARKHPLPDRFL
ncbi:hypothetical protein RBSWK_04766 [Rhodopirellula baltica SWK14]|uniref:Uncharacterized protein n=1 Tax=Rhodopirellula baltica SWK14 TaxID=993516 RepID=L7CDY9_RHOBT|nr:hypothetical protein RBSWK_04766 [Rhodopirellula baltica SWK14]